MKVFNKLLIASTMVVTLGATTSCGNNKQDFIGGLPYTVLALDGLEKGKEYPVKFECEGKDVQIYWDSEEASSEKEHTFKCEEEDDEPIVLIKGNVTSLQLCDKDGEPLALGNQNVRTLVLSNTIQKIPEHAFYGVCPESVYIPSSVKTIGKEAFVPYDPEYMYCEPKQRPSGWDPDWCTIRELNALISWGLTYYVTDDGLGYVLFFDGDVHFATYAMNVFFDGEDLVIPESIIVDKRSFEVRSISGRLSNNIKNVTLPKTIAYIGGQVFNDSIETITFAENYDFLVAANYAFGYCYNLEAINLPKGLVNLSYSMFEGCGSLKNVKVPNTVKLVDSDIFWGIGIDVTVDLTDYKDADSIAWCSKGILSGYDHKITFKIDGSSKLTKDDFVAKGWPDEKTSGSPQVHWDYGSSTLNA